MTLDVDVAVVGGGSAGVAAAIGAARCGARTLLADRSAVLGGNATNALVHTICGLYRPASASGAPIFANPGFPRAFAQRLCAVGAAWQPERAGRVFVLPTSPHAMVGALDALCAETAGLTVWSHCELTAAELADTPSGQSLLTLSAAGERRQVRTRIAIDASGDGALAAAAGADVSMAPPGALQIPSYIVRLGGIDTAEIEGFGRLRVSHAAAGAARRGALPPGCESVLVRRAAADDEVYVTLNVPKPGDAYRPLDADCVRALEAEARSAVDALVGFLAKSRAAFARARVVEWPRRIGIRETRRVLGRIELAAADVLAGRSHADEVARSSWPIELWPDHRRARFEYPEAPCSIPLGALISRSHPRLGMAGRCLSASHEALGALRVIGTALASGEAIGVAAARAADADVALSEIAPAAVRDDILRLADAAGGTPA